MIGNKAFLSAIGSNSPFFFFRGVDFSWLTLAEFCVYELPSSASPGPPDQSLIEILSISFMLFASDGSLDI
jgi:hypothetical protein